MSTSRKRPPRRRAYDSPLRAEQAAATRRRILDGALAAAGKVGELEIPALAKAIHVSVPTIYRHFPSRADLLRAAIEHVETLVPMKPCDEDDLAGLVRSFFEWRAEVERRLGPMVDQPGLWDVRRAVTVPRRRKWAAELVRERVGALPAAQERMLIDLVVVLVSTNAATSFARYVDCTPAETAERVLFALEASFEKARSGAKRKRR